MPRHTEAELAAALNDVVGYELWMMAKTSARMPSAQGDGVAWNAYLESMLLHARSLIEFFVIVKDRPLPGDIRRTDFAPEWQPAPTDAVTRVESHYKLLHKYLAHLTWDRTDATKPAWTYSAIASDLCAIADKWSELLVSSPALYQALRPWVFWSIKLLSGDGHIEDDKR